MNPQINHIAIVGLGQIGGSLASALHHFSRIAKTEIPSIRGYDYDERVRSEALERRVIDRSMRDGFEDLHCADLVILATPVREIISLIPRVAKRMRPGAILVDVGSTKTDVVTMMDQQDRVCCFGGHPICGTEQTGPDGWDPTLFVEKTFVIVDTKSSREDERNAIDSLVRRIGARVVTMDAAIHDRLLATTSHLPLLLGNALLAAATDQMETTDLVALLIGGSFRSATRITQKPPEMIADLLSTNRAMLSEAYREFDRHVRRLLFEDALEPRTLLARLRTIQAGGGQILAGNDSDAAPTR